MQRGDFEEILQNTMTSAEAVLTALASYAMLQATPALMHSHYPLQVPARTGFRWNGFALVSCSRRKAV
jgi:hypothetical protein